MSHQSIELMRELDEFKECARVMVRVYKDYGCGYYSDLEFIEAFQRLARLIGQELYEED